MYHKDAPQTIQSLFNSIAKRYDRTNLFLSFSMHKYWNRTLVKQAIKHTPGPTLLDLCAGTGDIAFDYLKRTPTPSQAYLVDFSSEMLAFAKQKGSKRAFDKHNLIYIEADVQQLPLSNQLVDCATIAYGIRNVKEPVQCIQEVFRVLKPGGYFGILELTRPHSRFLRWVHKLYMQNISPFLGKMVANNQDAYQYLTTSIQSFVTPPELVQTMQSIGFIDTQCLPLAGGIATIIQGHKPQA